SKTAVPFLKERLRPAEPADPERIRQLIADLDSQQFAAREAASKELTSLGAEAEPALRAALKGSPSAEHRRRVEAILAVLGSRRVPSPEVPRRLRALQVLEQIGSTEARQHLETLARGAPAAIETREAGAALGRLTRQLTSTR